MYLTMTTQAFSALNSLDSLTSSTSTLGLTIQPTKMQVRIATMGMSTELEMKSKKSRIVLPSPSGCTAENTL